MSGTVLDASGRPVASAVVTLQGGASGIEHTTTDASGSFVLGTFPAGTYTLQVEKPGAGSGGDHFVLSEGAPQQLRIVLESAKASSPGRSSGILDIQAPEFSDKPNFTVAGVTDWTAVGGHGSDAVLRTSETLTRDTVALERPGFGSALAPVQPASAAREAVLRAALLAAPRSYDANYELGSYYLKTGQYALAVAPFRAAADLARKNPDAEYSLALACRGTNDAAQALTHVQRALVLQADRAPFHRLASQLEEQTGDSLAAVREQQIATRMDPSEENYFELGSELLLHRAIWQASQVFADGAGAYPRSARMQTAWGAALFAGARYPESAQRLCTATDLDAASRQPYLFLGQIAEVVPAPEPCVRQKLEQFVAVHPDDAQANYYLATLLVKQGNATDLQHAETLLTRAVALKPNYAQAHLQLGILAFARRDHTQAINEYTEAAQADPHLAEAHYRLGVAYDRMGKSDLARTEFERHDQLEKAQAEAVEQQRRQIKQFVIASQAQPN